MARKPTTKATTKANGSKAAKPQQAIPLDDGITASWQGNRLVITIDAEQAAIDTAPLTKSGRNKLVRSTGGFKWLECGDKRLAASIALIAPK